MRSMIGTHFYFRRIYENCGKSIYLVGNHIRILFDIPTDCRYIRTKKAQSLQFKTRASKFRHNYVILL